ncbi:MAG: hypothetical protein IKE42_15970 [Aquamicrobium sp.]|nr:hypothetical protein [Aquamicrobium sp.]
MLVLTNFTAEPGEYSMFDGLWENERGSQMRLHQEGAFIRGTYITLIGHDDAVRREHALTGMANEELIGFSVAWPAAGSLTSWAGKLIVDPAGVPRIHTTWHLVRDAVGDPPRKAAPWESFLTHTSVFSRVSPEASSAAENDEQ